MTTTPATTGHTADVPRARMVDRLRDAGHARSPRVEHALRTVPRHAFLPDAPIEDAYADIAVITKRASDGAALSCASMPTIVAMMLDQLDVQPGHRILEIGAGTGYNAALLAELTGPSGEVTTIDIDPDITAGARRALNATGYQRVRVITRDGALGAPEHAPYDRLIVTVGAWDLPPGWWHQLTPGGRLVVPLRWRGQTRSVAFSHHGNRLESESLELCGFVPMIGQDGEHTTHLDPDGLVTLAWDTDQPIDPAALHGVLAHPKTVTWSGVTVGSEESFDGIWLRLTATEPTTCRITAQPAAVTTGLCTPAIPARSPALAQQGSIAYLTHRRPDGSDPIELGAAAHGAAGPQLAERLTDQIHAWDSKRGVQPVIFVYPPAYTERPSGGVPIHKRRSRLNVIFDRHRS